jgi:hypothetical protein
MPNAFTLKTLAGPKALAALCALVVVGCSGSSGGTSPVHIRCAGGESFCIFSCDLGCTQTGCSVTQIAENQRLKFTFSGALDPGSVNGASFSIRTVTGAAPEGDVNVTGNVLEFAPRVRTVNGISTFGFRRNETYIISMSGGSSGSFGLRSAAGDALSHEFTCTVVATLGIVDEDQLPPSVTMIAPTSLTDAPRDPTILLRFSELIDTTPLRGTLTAASPVRFTLHTANEINGVFVCDRESSGLTLEGIPRLSTERVGSADVTVVEFKPTVLLPGRSCVEVVVTADLRDLSGRAAVPNRFNFITEAGTPIPIEIAESFATPSNLDTRISGGTWNLGATPGLIGGDGRHGSFDFTLGTPLSSSAYQFDTTNVVIPAANSLTGLAYTVTDGKFYFTDFAIPAGITVSFIGPVPPQIWVRGEAEIAGTVRLNGATMTRFNARGSVSTPAPYIDGQPGGVPGAGGGRGGKGGNECQGTGPIIVGGVTLTNGQNGEDVRLLAGHGYAAQSLGTGGHGSAMNPPTGDNNFSNTQPLIGFVYRAYFAPGGGGGGFSQPGGVGAILNVITNLQAGAIPAGGTAFNIGTMSTTGYTSLDHYLVGGAGGGGGGTHNFGTIYISGSSDVYTAGSGGSGGGGAFALRVGRSLVIGSGARCEAKGGTGVLINGKDAGNTVTGFNWGVSSPGGGGSGGSFLFQSGGSLTIGGVIDTGGGNGSSTGSIATATLNLNSAAGAGSPGFYRLEAGGAINLTSTGNVPTFNPATQSGVLTDRDDLSGCTSLWYTTNQVFPPAWLRYELEVDTNGDGTVDITYTDSGEPGTQLANDPNGPVIIQFQGARMLQSTGEPEPGTIGPWRLGIGSGATSGISLDSPTGFRFMMTFNRGAYRDCRVRGLRVHARA